MSADPITTDPIAVALHPFGAEAKVATLFLYVLAAELAPLLLARLRRLGGRFDDGECRRSQRDGDEKLSLSPPKVTGGTAPDAGATLASRDSCALRAANRLQEASYQRSVFAFFS